jgi:hypothetical protein
MAKLIVRELRDGDLDAIAAGLRQADRDEIEATTGQTDVLPVLQDGVAVSSMAWAIEVGGEPAGVFGVAPAVPDVGVPWMLGTYALERAPKQLTKLGRAYVHRMTDKYETLVNYVDARNVKSVYWLSRLGFTVSPQTEPFGVAGLPFHRFGMNRPCAPRT